MWGVTRRARGWLMTTVITWASSGINGDRTSCITAIVDCDCASQSYPATFVIPLTVLKRTHSQYSLFDFP